MSDPTYHMTTTEVVAIGMAVVGAIVWLIGIVILFKYAGKGTIS